MTIETSLLVQRQVPGFVREDHPQFVEFLKAYYKFLEQPTNEYKDIKYITDVDVSFDKYENNFLDTYANLLSKNYKVDGAFLIKNVLPLYLSKGSERSFKFLFRLLFDEEITIRYLRDNILHTSASKWVKENSLNISSIVTSKYVGDGVKKEFYLIDYVSQQDVEVFVDDVQITTGFGVSKTYRKIIFNSAPANNSIIEVKYQVTNKEIFLSRKVTGLNSKATCVVEKTSFELINNRDTIRLYVNTKTVNGSFTIGEKLHFDVFINGVLVDVELASISELRGINIIDGGANYNVGDPALIVSPGAVRNPVAIVRRVFYPVIESLRVYEGGCGFHPGDNVTVNGIDFPVTNVKIGSVYAEPFTQNTANLFVIYSDVISDIDPANTLISVDGYGLSSVSGNLNTSIHYCLSEIQYSNIGEIIAVDIDKISFPIVEVPTLKALPAKLQIPNVGFTLSNTNVTINTFGSLGKIVIDEQGTGYSIGDEIVFTPKPMCFGIGASAEVVDIDSLGQITNIDFVPAKITGTANVNISTSNTFVQGNGTLFQTELNVGDKIMINRETKFVSDISSNTTLNVTSGFTDSFQNKPVRSYKKYAIGGQGYKQDNLPNVSINSATGSNAVIRLISVMGEGDDIRANITPLNGRKIGAIEQFQILDAGESLVTFPSIDMTNYGSGNAKAEAVLYSTYETYDGRWISTDSHLSSSDRKLQGLNYYINHSYVISSSVDYGKYKKIVKDVVHPAGHVGYAEYLIKNELQTSNAIIETDLSYGTSFNVSSIPVNFNVSVASVFTNNAVISNISNVSNFLINQLPGFSNVSINVANTVVFVGNEIDSNITIANSSVFTSSDEQSFQMININTSVTSAFYDLSALPFAANVGVVITSDELNSLIFEQIIDVAEGQSSVISGNSKILINNLFGETSVLSGNSLQILSSMSDGSLINSPNSALWPITFI